VSGEHGFSLVELLIVLGILAVLVSVVAFGVSAGPETTAQVTQSPQSALRALMGVC